LDRDTLAPMDHKNIILQNTSKDELRNIIRQGVLEALEFLRAEQTPKLASAKISRQQLKDEYHLSFPTILKLEKNGTLKGYRIGRRVLFDRHEVEQSLVHRNFNSQ
jgi:excisionase family DNA binding protein